MRHKSLLLGLTLLALTGCSNSNNSSTARLVVHRGLGGDPSTLNPLAAADNYSFEVLRDLYEGLTAESSSGEIIPGVAQSWAVDESGKIYTFQLRRDAFWSNGKKVRAQDFVEAWQRVLDPKLASPVADDLRLISGATLIMKGTASPNTLGVHAISDDVLSVALERPAPYFPQLLTHSAAYPIYSDPSRAHQTRAVVVSNGAYVLSQWSHGTTLDLIKNPYYWDQANVHIPSVQYQIADETSQYARYRSGQLDITDTVPTNVVPALRAQQSKELVTSPFLATAYYGINLSERPFNQNVKLRQAMAMAIDRTRLVNSLAFGQVGAYSFVPPGIWNYSPGSWEWKNMPDALRIAEAKRLYSESGYLISNPLRIRLLFNSNVAIKNTAIIIAQMWKETLGIETALTEEEYRVFLQSRHEKSRWDVVRLGWTADYNDASNFLDIFRQHSNNNDVGYSDPDYDSLLDKAANTANAQHRRELLELSERKLLAEYPIIPLYFFVSKRMVKPYLKGVEPNPLNRVPSKNLRFISE